METDLAADVTWARPRGDDAVGETGEDAADSPEATIEEVDRILDAVEAALTRLDDGTYRLCSQCGTTMDDGRLAADPTATACIDCETVSAGGPASDVGTPPSEGEPVSAGERSPEGELSGAGHEGPFGPGYAAPSSSA